MTDPNDDLRRLFSDATADIRPQGTLDDIRSRTETKVDPMTRRWFLPALVAAAVLGLVVGGGFWLQKDDGSTTALPSGTPGAVATDAPATADPTPTAVSVFYVGEGADGPRLFSETHRVTAANVPLAAVQAAATGTPDDADYRSYWPAGMLPEVRGVHFDGTGETAGITIDVGAAVAADRPRGVTAEQAAIEVQALVRTAQAAFGEKAPVEFYAGDSRLDTVLGVPGPTYTAGNDADDLALVSITSPANNVSVKPGALTVTGQAAAFEANVVWELLVGGDAVAQSGHATAQECCTLSPYEFTIKDLAPGTYTLVVHDTDESGEGKPENRDSKEIIVE